MMMMEMSAIKSEVMEYLKKSGSGLSVTRMDEQNQEIHMSSADDKFTFYISCPASADSGWNVWSECTKSQEVLQHVMDSCDLSTCRNVSAILEAVLRSLKSARKIKSCQGKPGKTAGDNKKCSDAEDGAADDYDDDLDNYYMDYDVDAQEEVEATSSKVEEDRELASGLCSNPVGSQVAIQRLIKDLKSLRTEGKKYGIAAEPRQNNLFIWDVKLFDIPENTKLGRDLATYAKKYKTEPVLNLSMQFPDDFPFSPPFVRVVKPRFKFLTGHVTVGGSICMQMLTKSGWQPTNDIEGVLIQVRAEILSDKEAALNMHNPNQEYTESEAKVAFQRMLKKYGW